MGNCCPCLKGDEGNVEERRPLNRSSEPAVAAERMPSRGYETVVDWAQRKFINSTDIARIFTTQDSVCEKRSVIDSIKLDVGLMQSPKVNHQDYTNHQLVDIVKAPVKKEAIEGVADRIAEAATNHLNAMDADTNKVRVSYFQHSGSK